MEALDIYSYLDYRAFCRDFYHRQKATDPQFSYRSFARKAHIAAAYLKHVIDGKRNLSAEMSIRFGRGMDLNDREVDYFETLVRFSQSSTVEEKNIYFDRLRRQRAKSLKSFSLVEAARLLTHWYVIAIKEIVVNLNTIDVRLIQRALRKKLPESMIEKVVKDLLDYGFLVEQSGRWKSTASQIQFPDEVRSFVIQSFHHQMLELAVEALNDELQDREFQAAVFTFPTSRIQELKDKIKDMNQGLVAYVQDISDNTQDQSDRSVFYFGSQCFSLQKKEGVDRVQ